jgi:hypothetical protein
LLNDLPFILPSWHTVHCLVDVKVCSTSDFEILTPPPPGSDEYVRSWRVTQGTKSVLIDEARRVGDPDNWCRTCEDGGLEQVGFRATIKATVTALADPGNGIPPIVAVQEAFTSRTTDPDTLESTMVSDDPCKFYFQMGDSSEAAVLAPTPLLRPTSPPVASPMEAPEVPPTEAIPAPSVPPTDMASDTPSDMPSDVPSDMPSKSPAASTLVFTEAPSASPVPASRTQPVSERQEPNFEDAKENVDVTEASASKQVTTFALAAVLGGLLL